MEGSARIKSAEEAPNLRVGSHTRSDREVVGARDDLNPVREGALAAHILLEGRARRPAAVDLTIQANDYEERLGELLDDGGHHVRLEGPREGPAHVARSVAHVGADRGGAARDVVVEGGYDAREDLGEAGREEEAAAGELREGEAPAVPRV